MNTHYRFVFVSERFTDVFGWPTSTVVGKLLADLANDNERGEEEQQATPAARPDLVWSRQRQVIEHESSDGRLVSVNCTPVTPGGCEWSVRT